MSAERKRTVPPWPTERYPTTVEWVDWFLDNTRDGQEEIAAMAIAAACAVDDAARMQVLMSRTLSTPETRPGARPGEAVCEGCIHGPACRVIPCSDCGKTWHLLGLISDPFVCPRCEDAKAGLS